MSEARVTGTAGDIIRSVHEGLELERTKVANMCSWPGVKALQTICEKYGEEYEFETFRKEILPNLYPEIFDLMFDRKERNLEAVFKLKNHDSVKEVHDEISSPIYLRKFSEMFYPYINREIDAIFGFFGTSYDEHVGEYRKAIEFDREISELIAFEYTSWETFTWYDGGEMEGDDYLEIYRCDVNTAKISSKH